MTSASHCGHPRVRACPWPSMGTEHVVTDRTAHSQYGHAHIQSRTDTHTHKDTHTLTLKNTHSHTETHTDTPDFLAMDTSVNHSQVFPGKHQGGGSFCDKHAVPEGPGGPLLGGQVSPRRWLWVAGEPSRRCQLLLISFLESVTLCHPSPLQWVPHP